MHSLRAGLWALLLLVSSALLAQHTGVTGRVLSATGDEPLPFVNITYNGTGRGTASDIDGKFRLDAPVEISQVRFSFVGFEVLTLTPQQIAAQKGVVRLKEKTTGLNEVTVYSKENPAHRIIRRATANRDVNNPENLETFSYESYNKLLVTMNPDSIDFMNDDGSIDTSLKEFKDFMQDHHLFFMESATERQYVKGKRDYENVLASRVSGFKNTEFALLATNLQSFSLYDDFIEILGVKYLNPISKGSTNRYFFLLQDTVYSGTDSVFVVSFRPRPGHTFRPLTGLLYIHTDGYALQNVIAQQTDSNGISVRIRQNYARMEGHWFPQQLNADIFFPGVSVNGIRPRGIGRTYLKNIRILPELNPRSIPRVNLETSPKALQQSEDFWSQYRPDTLDSRQQNTYTFIDSLSEAENFEQRLNFFQALFSGKLRVGVVDFDLGRLFNYNIYEGFRLGAGVELNERTVWWWRPELWAAYGFADQTWKWGGGMTFTLNRRQGLEFYAGYSYDLRETGSQDLLNRPPMSILTQDFRRFGITQWDLANTYTARITWQALPRVTTYLGWEGRRHNVLGPYTYTRENGEPGPQPALYSEAQLAFWWTPRARMVLGSKGLRRSDGLYPSYKFEVRQGLEDLGSNFSYTRLDAEYRDVWNWRRLGATHFTLRAGTRLGESNASMAYAPQTFRYTTQQWPYGPVLADPQSFQTLQNNAYLMGTFASMEWRQKLGPLLGRDREKFKPQFDVIARALWGLPDKSGGLHQGTDRLGANGQLAPEAGYYEFGVEVNRLWSTLGVGVYYGGPAGNDPNPSFFTARLTISGLF